MTRIDMTAREWHNLTAPVLPHASTDKDDQDLGIVRLEANPDCVYAIATDRRTIAAERHQLHRGNRVYDTFDPVHLRRTDIDASLRLFKHTKDEDPMLRITVDTVAIPIQAAGQPTDVPRLAVTIDAEDGTRLVMHDRRDPAHDGLQSWRKTIRNLWARPLTETSPALSLNAQSMAKWSRAARPGERLAVFAGAKEGSPLLILIGDHFAGVWGQVNYLDGPDKMLTDSPWASELGVQLHLTGEDE